MENTSELLRQYAEEGSESAFRALVGMTLPLVYGCALRRLGDPHLAQDAAQRVFTDLAHKAKSLCHRPVLASWLYISANYAASNIARSVRRQRKREAPLNESMERPLSPDPSWDRIKPLIDEELQTLGRTDREAIILRFFEGKTFLEVGLAINASEEAARKRVERSLEKLRHNLESQGIASSAAALGNMLATQMAGAAPAGMASALAKTALSTTPLSSQDESRMIPERVKRVRQRGQEQRVRASISQRLTSGSEGSFF
jgi:RNA polymerase sigma factor (sigma-70 family)